MSDDNTTNKSTAIPLPLTEAELSLSEIQKEVDKIQSGAIPFNEKLDLIIQLKTRLAPAVLKECFNTHPNPDVSLIASRVSSILKNTADLIIKKRELEVSDELNPHSPKFQKAFQWFLELIHSAIQENGVDEVQTNNIFATLSSRLVGWEDLLVKQLKGISGKASEEVSNPFIKKLKEDSSNAPVEEEQKPKRKYSKKTKKVAPENEAS